MYSRFGPASRFPKINQWRADVVPASFAWSNVSPIKEVPMWRFFMEARMEVIILFYLEEMK
jgi:hypothetical protein